MKFCTTLLHTGIQYLDILNYWMFYSNISS